jgi:hypothetical protein
MKQLLIYLDVASAPHVRVLYRTALHVNGDPPLGVEGEEGGGRRRTRRRKERGWRGWILVLHMHVLLRPCTHPRQSTSHGSCRPSRRLAPAHPFLCCNLLTCSKLPQCAHLGTAATLKIHLTLLAAPEPGVASPAPKPNPSCRCFGIPALIVRGDHSAP